MKHIITLVLLAIVAAYAATIASINNSTLAESISTEINIEKIHSDPHYKKVNHTENKDYIVNKQIEFYNHPPYEKYYTSKNQTSRDAFYEITCSKIKNDNDNDNDNESMLDDIYNETSSSEINNICKNIDFTPSIEKYKYLLNEINNGFEKEYEISNLSHISNKEAISWKIKSLYYSEESEFELINHIEDLKIEDKYVVFLSIVYPDISISEINAYSENTNYNELYEMALEYTISDKHRKKKILYDLVENKYN